MWNLVKQFTASGSCLDSDLQQNLKQAEGDTFSIRIKVKTVFSFLKTMK